MLSTLSTLSLTLCIFIYIYKFERFSNLISIFLRRLFTVLCIDETTACQAELVYDLFKFSFIVRFTMNI